MVNLNTTSYLGGVPIKVMPPIVPFVQRRTATITYERAKSRSFSVARGERGLRITARVYDDTYVQALLDLWESTGEGLVQFSDDQRNLHSGYYVLGDLELPDESHASTVVTAEFTLLHTGNIGGNFTEEFL